MVSFTSPNERPLPAALGSGHFRPLDGGHFRPLWNSFFQNLRNCFPHDFVVAFRRDAPQIMANKFSAAQIQ